MSQLVVILVGVLAVNAVIGFGFGGRVTLPAFARRRPARPPDGPAPEPDGAPRPRAEVVEMPGDEPSPSVPPDSRDDTSTWQPPRARRWPLRDAVGRTVGRVERLEDRETDVGPYTVAISEFRLTLRTGLDHARLLDAPAVVAALDDLAAAPQDEAARDRAADVLTGPERWGPGGAPRQETLLLSVPALSVPPGDRSALLGGVLILRSQGVLGGVERPRDRFEHVLPRTPEAAAALAAHPSLARALVERYCPRGPGPTGALDDEILAAVRPEAA